MMNMILDNPWVLSLSLHSGPPSIPPMTVQVP